MKIEVFNNNRVDEYKEYLSALPVHLDVFYHPEYLNSNANYTNSSWEVFYCTSHNEFFVYPYLVETIYLEGLTFRDITSAYGYSGPACSSERFGRAVELEFVEYCNDQAFVSEFVRYHYDPRLTYMFKINAEVLLNRKLVILDLKQDWNTIWQNCFSKTNQNLVRKVENNGFRIATTEEISVDSSLDYIWNI